MPVIIVGADTPLGEKVVAAFDPLRREVRAFVTDVASAERLKRSHVKVAVGDVSDGSHVGGAALRSFSAVLLAEAATDGRERSFASTADGVVAAWVQGLHDAGVERVIWVDDGSVPSAAETLGRSGAQVAHVTTRDRSDQDVVDEITALDDAEKLPT
jgi:hypothetical protein